MFSPLRRFEFGKMLLNIIPVLPGSAFVSKIFTEFSWSFRIIFGLVIGGFAVAGFFFLPNTLRVGEKETEER